MVPGRCGIAGLVRLGDNHTVRILIIDDHPLFREGVGAVLRQWTPDAVLRHARDADEGLVLASQDAYDMVLLDLNLPGLGGISAIARLQKILPRAAIVVVSSSEDAADVRRSMDAGARGYLPKSSSAETIVNALQLILAGDPFVPAFMLHAETPAAPGALTLRQIDVLKLLCEGMPNKEIGRKLGMAEKTTKNHISAIFRSLKVVNRTQAVIAARRSGLIV